MKTDPLYISDFVDSYDFAQLENIDWVQRDDAPRKEYWDTTLGKSYTYGSGRGIRTYEPNEPLGIVASYRKRLEDTLGVFFEGCFLNKYESKRDHLGWHADDEKELGNAPIIGSVSLGETRDFILRRNDDKSQKIRIPLGNGSVLIMMGDIQRFWQHSVPKRKNVSQSRINLTFRNIL